MTDKVNRELFGVDGMIVPEKYHTGLTKRRTESAAERHLDQNEEVLASGGEAPEDRGTVMWNEARQANVRVVNGVIVEEIKRKKP